MPLTSRKVIIPYSKNLIRRHGFPLLRAWFIEYFYQNRRVTRILDLKIESISNVIEKSFETGVAIAFGGFFGCLGKPGWVPGVRLHFAHPRFPIKI